MKPLVTLLWGMGGDFSGYINLVQALEFRNEITVTGITAGDIPYRKVYGYRTIPKTAISSMEIDLIIVMTDKAYLEIENEIARLGIEAGVIPCKVLSIPGFRVKEYLDIKNSIPTYFSVNCWAGLLYHRLRLPFCSPTVNMFIEGRDYIRFLKSPKAYMEADLEFKGTGYDEYLGREYPIALCKDMELHLNHYVDFTGAKSKWEERRARINWKRIIVMMYTEDRGIAKEFSMLPYPKKMCFVPFDADLDGVYKIGLPRRDNMFFEIVNGIVSGRYQYYNILGLAKGVVEKVVE